MPSSTKFPRPSWSFALFVPFVFNLAIAQTIPATAPSTTTAPSTQPQNIDKALLQEISFDAPNRPLEDAVALLRSTTHTNIAVNWTALAAVGITRQTPVTLRLHNLPYEQVLRALMDVLPAAKSRPNFTIGENTIEISTTAALAKRALPRIYDITLATSSMLDNTKPTPEQRVTHADFLKRVLHQELLNAGEEPDAPNHNLIVKDDRLVATQSQRAQLFIQWTITLFESPTKLHQTAEGTALSVQAKKSEDRLAALKLPLAKLAADPEKLAPDLNILLLPDTAAELAQPEPKLDYFITGAGVIEIGPASEIIHHITLGIYDLRDVLKRLAFKSKQKPAPEPADLAAAVLALLKEKIAPYPPADATPWGDLEKSPNTSPSSLTLYEGYLVVFAPAQIHRTLAAALEDIYKQ